MTDLIDHLGLTELRRLAVCGENTGIARGTSPRLGALFGLAPFAPIFGLGRRFANGRLSAAATEPKTHSQNNDDGDDKRHKTPPLISPAICHGEVKRSMRGPMLQRNMP